jgi:DUF2934 family protein
MSDNPLEDTPERTAHIRSTAYRLWEENGQPNGRDEEFWESAPANWSALRTARVQACCRIR